MSAKLNSTAAKILPFALAAATGAVWFWGVGPSDAAMKAVRQEVARLSGEVNEMNLGLQELAALEREMAQTATNRAAYAGCVIEPLLGSVAMRAKTLLDPIAAEVGIEDVRYEDASTSALPPTETSPRVPYVRARVSVMASASYMSLVSFLSRVERQVPGACVVSAYIGIGGRDVEVQVGTFVFEWLSEPPEGEMGGRAQ